MQSEIAENMRLFNEPKFFEAHEALEAVWLTCEGTERALPHSLIQSIGKK